MYFEVKNEVFILNYHLGLVLKGKNFLILSFSSSVARTSFEKPKSKAEQNTG
jgi:hypothetical protein